MGKVKVNLSLDSDIVEKLDLYSCERHLTRSAAITQLVLDCCRVNSSTQLRGQMNFKDVKIGCKTSPSV